MRSGLLSEAAQLVLPDGITSSGWPSTRETCRKIGIEFDGWQRDLNRCILAKASDGLYAADTVAMSIPRQVGKTFDVGGVVFADSIINPGTTTVWTAHRFKVARESFQEMRGWAMSPQLKAHIDADTITTAAGNECIPFRNGSRIVFAARERGAIRGFTKVRRLVLDEGQILTDQALADLVPTMNQAVNPQIILMGTPPKPTDPGEVFSRFRTEALGGLSTGLLYVEFSAPAGSDPLDRQAWRLANPSYPSRTPAKAIMRLYKLLSADDFRREALGIWDDDNAKKPSELAKLLAAWELALDPASQMVGKPSFGLDVAPDQSWSAIATAGPGAAGLTHVELTGRDLELDYRPGTDWVLPVLIGMKGRHPGFRVSITGDSGAKALRLAIEQAGIPVDVLDTSDIKAACGLFFAHATSDRLRHIGQEPLTDALKAARKLLENGEAAWRWGRKRSTGDITALYAATAAVWAAEKASDLSRHPVNNVW